MKQQDEIKYANLSPVLVAEELLQQAWEQGKSLTVLQLIKLVYLCQGWGLALEKTAFFNEDIEAWTYGPVIPSVYHAYKHFGKSEIPMSEKKVRHTSYPIDDNSDKAIDGEQNESLKKIAKLTLDAYGDFSGTQLSNLTHQDDTPWKEAYDGSRNKTIEKSTIQKHFKSLMQKYSKKNK